jgi:hypothetical protein
MFHLFHRTLNRLSKPSPRLFMPRVEVRSTWWNFVPRGGIARSGECMNRVVHVLDIHGYALAAALRATPSVGIPERHH